MRISTPPIITSQKNEGLNKKQPLKANANPLSPSKARDTREAKGEPISRNELVSLAADFKNGLIDTKEANKRFIKTVVNNSIGGKLGEKDREQIISSLGEKDREQIISYIREFLSADPNFETELAQKLKDFV